MRVKYFPDTDTAHIEFRDKAVQETKELKDTGVGLLLTIGYPAADKADRKKVRKTAGAMSSFNGYGRS